MSGHALLTLSAIAGGVTLVFFIVSVRRVRHCRRRMRREFRRGAMTSSTPMAFSDLVAPLAQNFDVDEALESWRWLVPQPVKLHLLTACGDLFLIADSGAVLFLDTASGTCSEVATSVNDWNDKLRQPELLTEWFLPGLVSDLHGAGSYLAPGKCYSASPSIVLGGRYSAETWSPTPWRVHFAALGLLHEQLKDLEPGTPITKLHYPRL